MPTTATRVRIFVASPSDVAGERDQLAKVVQELNITLSALAPRQGVVVAVQGPGDEPGVALHGGDRGLELVRGVSDEALLRRRIQNVAARAGTGWQAVRRGQVVRDGDVEVRVVHPQAPEWERREVRNDDSVVLDVRYGRVSVVLPGDIGRAVEASLGSQLEPAPIRVLKTPHHGSANSNSAAWIDAVRARVAIVSAGAGNRYNHPGRAALERYAARRVPVFRTDRDGAVAIETDGRTVIVRTWSGRVVRLE